VNRSPFLLAGLMIVTLLAGCSGQPIQRRDGSSSVRSFSLKELAKGGVQFTLGLPAATAATTGR